MFALHHLLEPDACNAPFQYIYFTATLAKVSKLIIQEYDGSMKYLRKMAYQ